MDSMLRDDTPPPLPHFLPVSPSGCGMEAQRIEEMEKMLKEAQQEKARLIENRVSYLLTVYIFETNCSLFVNQTQTHCSVELFVI